MGMQPSGGHPVCLRDAEDDLGFSGGSRRLVFARGGSHFSSGVREKFLWRLPAFKEARLSRVAASLHLFLKNGVNLPDAIGLEEPLETNGSGRRPASVAEKYHRRHHEIFRGRRGQPAVPAAVCLGRGQRGRGSRVRASSARRKSISRGPFTGPKWRCIRCCRSPRCFWGRCFVAGFPGHQHVFAAHRHAERFERRLTG